MNGSHVWGKETQNELPPTIRVFAMGARSSVVDCRPLVLAMFLGIYMHIPLELLG
jgi:hypothetical protein